MASSSSQHQSTNQHASVHDYAPPRASVQSQGFQVVTTSPVVSSVNKEFVLILTNKPKFLRYDPRNAQQEPQRQQHAAFSNLQQLGQTADMNSDDENLDNNFLEELYQLVHAYLDRTHRPFPLDYVIEWSNNLDH